MLNIIVGAAALAFGSVVGYATQRKKNKEVVKTFLDNSGRDTAVKITNTYIKGLVDSIGDTELKSKHPMAYTTDDLTKLREELANGGICNSGDTNKSVVGNESIIDSIDPNGDVKKAIDNAIGTIVDSASDVIKEASGMISDVAETVAKSSSDAINKVREDAKNAITKQVGTNVSTNKPTKQKKVRVVRNRKKKPKQETNQVNNDDNVVLGDNDSPAMGKLGDVISTTSGI